MADLLQLLAPSLSSSSGDGETSYRATSIVAELDHCSALGSAMRVHVRVF